MHGSMAVLSLSRAWILVVFALGLGIQSQLSFAKRIHQDGVAISTRPGDNRLVGGQIAELGFAPYQISIRTTYGSHICGGVIIGSEWVLTAAHCVLDFPLEVLEIVVGTNNWRKPGAVFRPQFAVPHCMYDLPHFYHNDIAAVHLNGSIEFNNYTKPVELASEHLRAGDVVTLTGWGTHSLHGELPDELYKLDLVYISKEDCMAAWNNYEGVDVGHICTYTRAGEGACNGDSGGPLVNKDGKLVGLVNWGYPCANGKPDMHANVVYYRDFIELARTQCTRLRG